MSKFRNIKNSIHGCGLNNEAHHERNQPNKAVQVISFTERMVLWLYTSNKMEHFSYEGGCGIRASIYLKEVLPWAVINKYQFSNNGILLT